MKRKILLFLPFCYAILANAQVQNTIDLSTGVYDDNSLMPLETVDPDWTCTLPYSTVKIPQTRHTYEGWSGAELGGTRHSVWITAGGTAEGTYKYVSKIFEIPEDATLAK